MGCTSISGIAGIAIVGNVGGVGWQSGRVLLLTDLPTSPQRKFRHLGKVPIVNVLRIEMSKIPDNRPISPRVGAARRNIRLKINSKILQNV